MSMARGVERKIETHIKKVQACSVKIGFDNTYPVDNHLSREYIAPSIFQQLGSGVNLDKIKTF